PVAVGNPSARPAEDGRQHLTPQAIVSAPVRSKICGFKALTPGAKGARLGHNSHVVSHLVNEM
ncbi:hypothetical protein, partial [Pseudorhodoplanes sp.]|uniref:hypothetical protein n=1 Tax=Pseudorhodoplanes sp. TaxID=1934341 RepID=UPI003D0A883A